MGVMFDPFNNGGYTKNQIDDILSHKADLDNDGLVPISQLPQVAFSECITVQNQAERFALTPDDVQKGDIIYQNDTQIMYFVIDITNLDNEAGYKPFAAGIAAQAVADKDGNEITETYQRKINSQNKLNADNVDDSNAANKFVTAEDKISWDNKSDFSGNYEDLNNTPDLSDMATKTWVGQQGFLTSVNEVPEVELVNNDMILRATYSNGQGTYDWDSINEVPLSTPSEEGRVLTVDNIGNPRWSETQQEQSNWNENDNTKKSFIKNKPELANVAISGSYNDLNNKPTIPSAQVNSDWNANSGVAEILNKPTLGSAAALDVAASGDASSSQVVKGDDSRLTDFNGSGTNASAGLVPSPGSIQGNTRFLREDGTWNQPQLNAEDISYDNTETPVPSTNVQNAIDNIYDLILPVLTVNITALSSISITDGTTTITGTANVGGKFKTQIPNFGTWTITATLNGDTATEEIIINQIKTYEVEMRYTQIYGVSWGFSGKVLSRTDKSALFTDPIPYVNDGVMTVADCSSPFDNLGPWSGIEVSIDTLGNSLVSIPKFWYKIQKTASALTIQIADGPVQGFHVSPAHRARNAQENDKDVVYIGRYHSSSADASKWKSVSGVIPIASITRAAARTGVHNLGAEYWQLDMSMWITIWMLYIVEFANWDSQAMIGYNCGNNSSKENTGSTDLMPYHTGTMQASKATYGVGVQYRYIEDPWGNVLDWCDGITFNNADIYCFDNFADYSDSYQSTGAKLVGTRPTTENYIKNWGLSSETGYEWFMYPSEVQSAQTEVPDYCGFNASGVVLDVGGYYYQSAGRGLFYLYGYYAASNSYAYIGVRLQRRPSN